MARLEPRESSKRISRLIVISVEIVDSQIPVACRKPANASAAIPPTVVSSKLNERALAGAEEKVIPVTMERNSGFHEA